MDILTAVQAKGFSLKKVSSTRGGEWAGPCPVCNDGTDRFRCWPQRDQSQKVFFCRQCKPDGGDLIEFFKWAEGLTYKEACAAAGQEPKSYYYPKPKQPTKATRHTFKPATHDDPAALWQQKANKFVDFCHQALMKDPKALQKLLDTRGITAETVEKFKLGMNLNEKYFRPRESWGLPTEIKASTQKPKKLWIPRGLVIPYITGGVVQRIRIRRPRGDLRTKEDPPYFLVPGSSMAIMLMWDRQKSHLVEESELDGILIHQEAGDLVGVLAMGTATAKPDATCTQAIAESECLLIALDYDPAGQKGSQWWLENYPQAKRWPVAQGKDPGEMFPKVDVRQWVLTGLPPAYHIGHSGLPCFQKGEAALKPPEERPQKEAATKEPHSHLPRTVRELGELLARYPVTLHYSANRIRMETPDRFRNDEVCNRISHLIFYDPDCCAYLDEHPNEQINRRNYYHG